jgi:hypothetical protein
MAIEYGVFHKQKKAEPQGILLELFKKGTTNTSIVQRENILKRGLFKMINQT